MFTVLIAEKEHIHAIEQDNKLFFEPFLENKELAFCEWNPKGQNLHDSVPGLLDTVGRRSQWRVVIVHNTAGEALKMRNPFDTVDATGLSNLTPPVRQPENGMDWATWEEAWSSYYAELNRQKEAIYADALTQPLQKLATWLCFRPEDYILSEVNEKGDEHDWAMSQLEQGSVKPSARLEAMEREQYKWELRTKEKLRRQFVEDKYLPIAYPTEIHCISPRTADTTFFDPDNYWSMHRESDYSTFADRNLYFDKMRFLVFDLLPRTHRNFRTDYIRFLASVLIFQANPAPSSAMQARRLYALESDTDDTPLCTLVTSYDRKLVNTADVINTEMDRIRNEIPGELSDKAAQAMFCTPKDIAVLLDPSCDTENVTADKDYGLFFDRPENELQKWKRDYRASRESLQYIAKQQARSVRKSVGQLHLNSEIHDVNVSRLTPFQIDDIREYTEQAENEMVASIPPDLSDISRYTDQLQQESEQVKKVIGRRMTKKTGIVLTAICLGLYLVCFLPFLLSNANAPKNVIVALVMALGSIALLGGILLVALIVMRNAVKNAVRSYNNAAKDILNEIMSSMKRFSKYLSASCNARRGYAVQNYARRNLDEYTKSLRIRKKHLEDIRRRRAYLAEDYGDYFGDRSMCDETMARAYDYDFDQHTEYTYPAPFLAGDARQIEFISSGNLITVPSSYVTRMLVRLEGIYEK